MTLPSPNLDDRNFEDLVQEARQRIARTCPQWSDLSPGDPGVVLLETFAYLTDVLLYRLNRLPEKAYIEFLRLMGVTLLPPAAARAVVRFEASRPNDRPVPIPRGTRVTVARAEGDSTPVFTTARSAQLEPGRSHVDVVAYHGELVEAELAGEGTGLPGQVVTARRPPIVAPMGDEPELVVAVETEARQLDERVPSREYGGKAYRIWRRVENFTEIGSDRYVYVVDRMSGRIRFAPAVRLREAEDRLSASPLPLAAVPAAGREIRLWYWRGGGPEGNVRAETLTSLKDPIPGLQATNPEPAAGGRPAEELSNALVRGPQELHSLRRAVTARDFELVAQQEGAVARARAFTYAQLWRHADPGTVAVLLVPQLGEERTEAEAVTREMLEARQTDEARQQVVARLEGRRPLGTRCLVQWVRYKPVAVEARVVVHREEEPDAVRRRLLRRLHRLIDPLGTWGFGQPLRASHVYDIVLNEAGVRYADRVSLRVEDAPAEDVRVLEADPSQAGTWYAGAGRTLFRSVDDADGWEPVAHWPEEEIEVARCYEQVPGLVAVAARYGQDAARIHISEDCGESWRARPLELGFRVRDLAWLQRDGRTLLLMATDRGLYQFALREPDAVPVQVLVDSKDQERGLYAVAVSSGARGTLSVAVAAQQTRGVYLSSEGGHPNTFRHIGLDRDDVRVLRVQQLGPRAFLWAGLAAVGGAPGKGCFRRELRGHADSPEGWVAFSEGWSGGSCHALAFAGSLVLAGTHQAGLLRLEAGRQERWEVPAVDCGLPLRSAERLLERINAVAGRAGADGVDAVTILVGGPRGVHRGRGAEAQYEPVSAKVFQDKVTLPATWLFSAAEHRLQVVSEDEAIRD